MMYFSISLACSFPSAKQFYFYIDILAFCTAHYALIPQNVFLFRAHSPPRFIQCFQASWSVLNVLLQCPILIWFDKRFFPSGKQVLAVNNERKVYDAAGQRGLLTTCFCFRHYLPQGRISYYTTSQNISKVPITSFTGTFWSIAVLCPTFLESDSSYLLSKGDKCPQPYIMERTR